MLEDPFLKLFIGVLLYILLLLLIRWFNIGRKKACDICNNCCPDCGTALNRIARLKTDRLAFHLTFRMFDFKRYICNECGWENLRWEDKFRPGGN